MGGASIICIRLLNILSTVYTSLLKPKLILLFLVARVYSGIIEAVLSKTCISVYLCVCVSDCDCYVLFFLPYTCVVGFCFGILKLSVLNFKIGFTTNLLRSFYIKI